MTSNILMTTKLIRGSIPASDSLSECSLAADLAFPRFLLLTDDWGCFLWDLAVIKGQLFPKRKNISERKLQGWLEEYRQTGMLLKWKDEQKEYGFFIHYAEYNREYESRRHARRTPEPPDDLLQKYLKHFKVVQKTSKDFKRLQKTSALDKKPPLLIPTPIPILTLTPKKDICSFSFEEIWAKYPKRVGKKEAETHFRASVKTEKDWQNIQIALKNYLESERVAKDRIQDGKTWFNNWADWIDYKEPVCKKCNGTGRYISASGYDTVCDCPKGKAIKIPEHQAE